MEYKTLPMSYLGCLVVVITIQAIIAAPFLSTAVDKENCRECPVGFEPRTFCNETHDTECRPCPLGYFSDQPGYDKCVQCSKCRSGYFAFDPCTHTANTLCEKCNFMAEFNSIDYNDKCTHEGKVVKLLTKRNSGNDYFDVSLHEANDEKYLDSDFDGMVGDDPGVEEYEAYDNDAIYGIAEDDAKPAPYRPESLINGGDVASGDIELENPFNYDDYVDAVYVHTPLIDGGDNTEESSGDTIDRVFESSGESSGEVLTTESYTEEEETTTEVFIPVLKEKNPGYKAEPESESEPPFVWPEEATEEPIEDAEVGILGNKKEEKGDEGEEGGLPIAAIIITVIVVGVIFFIIGFVVYRIKKRRSQNLKHPVNYDVAATTEKNQGNDTEMVNMNDSKEKDRENSDPNKPMLTGEADRNGHTKPDNTNGSPIDIITKDAQFDADYAKNLIKFESESGTVELLNTGDALRINMKDVVSKLSGGPLSTSFKEDTYRLDHIVFYCGSRNEKGSEHRIDGKQLPAEIQLMLWNCKTCSSYADACKVENGTAVVSLLVKVDTSNSQIDSICHKLPKVQYKGESTTLIFNPSDLLTGSTKEYWTYTGSTSETSQSANWVVFRSAIRVSEEQLGKFRRLRNHERSEEHGDTEAYLVDNNRDCCPVGDRTVYSSFKV